MQKMRAQQGIYEMPLIFIKIRVYVLKRYKNDSKYAQKLKIIFFNYWNVLVSST
jgi:hypothetical protein